MAADDFPNTPADQGLPTDLAGSSPYSGNRPASGARRATPGEVLSQGFQGAQNAGDFLGLDVEFTGSQDAGALGAGPLDLVDPPSTHDGSQDVVEPAPLPAGDPAQEFAEAPSAFEFGEDLGSEEGDLALAESTPRSRKPLLVGVFAFAALAAAGAYYWPTLQARLFGSDSEVASSTPPPAPAPGAAHDAEPGAKTAAGGASESSKSSAPARPAPEASDTTAPSSASPLASAATPARTPTPPADVQTAQTSGAPEPAPAFDGGALASLLGSAPSAPATPGAAGFPDLSGEEYSWASEDQLELIWRGNAVPLEAVNAPAKTLMPRVGAVRVFMDSGDVFEGRLYAVGQHRVWIDAAPGRVGLDGERVERIEVLPPPPAGVQPATGEVEVAGGKRVRVRVPGGMLYGRVLKAEGEDVILAREGGGRVRVKASEVEELGSGRTIVVGR